MCLIGGQALLADALLWCSTVRGYLVNGRNFRCRGRVTLTIYISVFIWQEIWSFPFMLTRKIDLNILDRRPDLEMRRDLLSIVKLILSTSVQYIWESSQTRMRYSGLWLWIKCIFLLCDKFRDLDVNKVIRPKSRASALSKKSGRQADEQTKTFKKTFKLATKSL